MVWSGSADLNSCHSLTSAKPGMIGKKLNIDSLFSTASPMRSERWDFLMIVGASNVADGCDVSRTAGAGGWSSGVIGVVGGEIIAGCFLTPKEIRRMDKTTETAKELKRNS